MLIPIYSTSLLLLLGGKWVIWKWMFFCCCCCFSCIRPPFLFSGRCFTISSIFFCCPPLFLSLPTSRTTNTVCNLFNWHMPLNGNVLQIVTKTRARHEIMGNFRSSGFRMNRTRYPFQIVVHSGLFNQISSKAKYISGPHNINKNMSGCLNKMFCILRNKHRFCHIKRTIDK